VSIRPTTFLFFKLAAFLCVSAVCVFAQAEFEGRAIREVSITFEGVDKNVNAVEQFRLIARDALGERYAAVRVRDAIERLYNTKEITSAVVEASDAANGSVDLRFVIRRKARAQRVVVTIPESDKSGITEQELLLRLDILDPGTPVTEATLGENANTILEYLRDRGFFKA
jgi:outer membrane protein assembly factor BamA